MPRFAILDHDHPFPHWDFLLEDGIALRGWRLLAEPQQGRVIAAEPIPLHRRLYLDYEGPVSGDRGRVVRWDHGTFEWDEDSANELRLRLTGAKMKGSVVLRLVGDAWTWEWH